MECLSGPQEKGNSLHRHFWNCVLLAGLFAPLLALAFFASPISLTPAFASTLAPSGNTFTVSPTQGPVGAVIAVSGNGVFFADGTQVNLGYTADYHTCNIVSGGQVGVVHKNAFNGWFRWPVGTGAGSFGVCISANNSLTFQVGSYQVLSASAPRVSVAPTIPKAAQQATVSGTNFLPGGTGVNLFWRSTNGGQSVQLGTTLSDGAGILNYTFTVPSHASTGSYTLTVTAGSGSPATLSATTTFQVSGITLAAVPTPVSYPSPTVAPTPVPTKGVTVTPHIVPTNQPINTNSGDLASKASLLMPIALGGALLIALALGAGVLLVRRQRHPVVPPVASSGPLLWSDAATLIGGGVNSGAGTFTPWSGAMYPGGNSPSGNPGMEYSPVPGPGPAPSNLAQNKAATIPFDPGLAEAMHAAQVSLFATPRPPVGEELEVQ